MLHRLALTSLLSAALVAPALGDTNIVVDDFESYADDTAFQTAWVETTGLGTAPAVPADHNSAILNSSLPGSQGNAADHIGSTNSTPGMVNQWGGVIDQTTGLNPAFTINPSATQNIALKFDMYISNTGNERMSVGLRHIEALPDGSDADTFPDANSRNILELGEYNQTPVAPIPPGAPTVSTQFAYRLINFGAVTSPVTAQPNWQYFTLAPELDRTTDTDSITNLSDIGAGWHTFSATIGVDSITLSLDLFRDGKTNLTRVDGTGAIEVGVGADGVDASITYQILSQSQGFNSLRFGGPSGATSAGTGANAFDNISLRLVDIVSPPTDDADFDQDGDVDGRDFLTWQRGVGTPGALLADGDADGDHDVDGEDLGIWQDQYGTGALASVSVVPEPASVILMAAAGLVLVAKRR